MTLRLVVEDRVCAVTEILRTCSKTPGSALMKYDPLSHRSRPQSQGSIADRKLLFDNVSWVVVKVCSPTGSFNSMASNTRRSRRNLRTEAVKLLVSQEWDTLLHRVY